MAFTRANFSRVAGSGNQALHLYTTADAIATVIGSGYFNSAYAELGAGDIIIVYGSSGGTPTVDVVAITSVRLATTVTSTATEGITAT
jgi:hypothetical protein